MDKIEGGVLDGLAVSALNLTLTRSAIRMLHTSTWKADKVNTVHDLVICLTGRAEYEIAGEAFEMKPGRAMLIPPGNASSDGPPPKSSIPVSRSISGSRFSAAWTCSNRWTAAYGSTCRAGR
nr:hypothetical protein [Marinicella sp. W31]MDC2879764.1 hypothetical protein [Marinicella sp. W31]